MIELHPTFNVSVSGNFMTDVSKDCKMKSLEIILMKIMLACLFISICSAIRIYYWVSYDIQYEMNAKYFKKSIYRAYNGLSGMNISDNYVEVFISTIFLKLQHVHYSVTPEIQC